MKCQHGGATFIGAGGERLCWSCGAPREALEQIALSPDEFPYYTPAEFERCKRMLQASEARVKALEAERDEANASASIYRSALSFLVEHLPEGEYRGLGDARFALREPAPGPDLVGELKSLRAQLARTQDFDTLRAEVERLTKEADEARAATYDLQTRQAAAADVVVKERDNLRAEVERLTAILAGVRDGGLKHDDHLAALAENTRLQADAAVCPLCSKKVAP